MKRAGLIRAAAFALLLLALVAEGQFPQRAEAKSNLEKIAQSVTIYRDNWGVPHVYGRTDYSVAFGFIYAQCEDNFWRVEDSYIQSLGRASEVYGDRMLAADTLDKIKANLERAYHPGETIAVKTAKK